MRYSELYLSSTSHSYGFEFHDGEVEYGGLDTMRRRQGAVLWEAEEFYYLSRALTLVGAKSHSYFLGILRRCSDTFGNGSRTCP